MFANVPYLKGEKYRESLNSQGKLSNHSSPLADNPEHIDSSRAEK
jgi:hypothetical protein